uniref:Putative lipoprotein signal peptide n=1 Tax=Tardiphaga robiniae TaxID=943830 RepID=A0A109ZYF1_9BRAD|nr:putative lipoprotein signal peptide [Tardiphaga robiniae]
MRLSQVATCLVLFCLSTISGQAAGIQLLDRGPQISGGIWYPCDGTPAPVELGKLALPAADQLRGVRDCPVSKRKHPLVLISHGTGGWFAGHHDTAETLADAGFIVVAINHPGDSGYDSSPSEGLSNWVSRPQDVVRAFDFMLNDWKDHTAIDPEKIGFFGFSKGGYTGLVLVGATLDFQRGASNCNNKSRFCEQVNSGDVPRNLPQDHRIKAAVLVDPAPTVAFTKDTLAAISIPIQTWRSELGAKERGVDPSGVSRVLNDVPGNPEAHVVSAGHFAFLPPCSPEFAASKPLFCSDPSGFDREAFHRQFNVDVVRFFRHHLASGTVLAK